MSLHGSPGNNFSEWLFHAVIISLGQSIQITLLRKKKLPTDRKGGGMMLQRYFFVYMFGIRFRAANHF